MSLTGSGLFDAPMLATMSRALGAVHAFRNSQTSGSEEEIKYRKDLCNMRALREKILLSSSPALVILPILLADNNIHAVLADYAGVWMASLKVAVASKPDMSKVDQKEHAERKKKSSRREKRASIQKNLQNLESSPTVDDLMLSDIGAVKDSKENFQESAEESRRNCVSIQLATHLSEKGDYHDQARAFLNAKREAFLRELLHLRKQKLAKVEQFTLFDSLREFSQNSASACDILVTYAAKKWELHEALVKGLLDPADYEKSLQHLLVEYKKITFDNLNAFKRRRAADEHERQTLLASTDEYCSKHLCNANRTAQIVKANAQPDEDGTSNSLFDPNRNNVLLNAALDEIKAREVQEMEKLDKLGDGLRQTREDLMSRYGVSTSTAAPVKMSPFARMAGNASNEVKFRNSELFDEEATALNDLHSDVVKKNNEFMEKFKTHMSSSALASLTALDQRFVQDGYLGEGRDELFDTLFWNMRERKWQSEAADRTRREFCENLVEELDGRLRRMNQKIFRHELKRIEKVNAFNEDD